MHTLRSSPSVTRRARAAQSGGRGGRGRERARRAAGARGRVVAEAGSEALGGSRGGGSVEGTRAMNPKAGGEEEDCVDSGAETGGSDYSHLSSTSSKYSLNVLQDCLLNV